MTFFESLLALLLVAVLLLQIARRLALPLSGDAGARRIGVAFIPGSPAITLEPETALALFIAPVLLDAGYDFPIQTARSMWRPLVALAADAVLATAAVVAWIGWWAPHLPALLRPSV
jgi:NhaP-type Na+/H+ or K+/H+ antiporter